MRIRNRCIALITLFGLAAAIAGCGTPREKTAPCKRPANLLSYASEPVAPSTAAAPGCGAMRPVNTYRVPTGPVTTGPVDAAPDTAIEAIDVLTAYQEPG
ncbi:hypothetical protein HNQ96_005066 [Aminobacter lissarensis]|uniref:Uncharacterized protein n=1 Tax=Aminobacter carboxidus TaxID=376165 RepID=A0A8E2BFU8_9HYPH|nr:hypothetical protein [Aminobacter lissarensis]